MSESKRLGRGLESLLGPISREQAEQSGALREIAVGAISANPYQPRRTFDEEALAELTSSIEASGLLQPIVVRPVGNRYELIAGERRWRAVQRLGWAKVHAVVREFDDRTALTLALIENLQRADLSPLDEAHAYRRLTEEFHHTQEAVAEAVGRSRSHVANTLRLLSLPPAVHELLDDGRLSAGHARALIGQSGAEKLARIVIERGLNVRETEALVRRATSGEAQQARMQRTDPHAAEIAQQLTTKLGLEVQLRPKARGGSITIRYRDLAQLDALLRRIA